MSENFSLDLLAHDPRRIGELTTEELAAVMALGSSLQMAVAAELVARQPQAKAEPEREESGNPYLDVDDVRRLWKLPSAKSVYRLVKKGILRPLRVGKRLRFRAVDLRELAAALPENVLDFPVRVTHSRARGSKTEQSEGSNKEQGNEKNAPRNDRRRAPRDSTPAGLDAKADGRIHGNNPVKHRKVRARGAENASPRRRFRPTGLEV